jgi:deoxyhypusine monooxygenase
LDRLAWLEKHRTQPLPTPTIYKTVDPAPALPLTTVDELKQILLDHTLTLFERYRAMFALRDIGSDEAILAICEGTVVY